ncbi:retinol dehydrogenase 13-like isoform X2 [Bradysia coprophila]|uniref:retinol dehydrogenase 13-like isoform X2 n=1 Tax=Bradysia coprophila TaxID=38358 RepID=UPI00187DBA92|nr:retinol dehydrogenase 13-like isoform X2 [Bradysia coprophila]
MLSFFKNKSVIIGSCVGTAVGGLFILKDAMQGERFKKKTRAENKVVLITGCNTGIGKETALELAKRGAHIYMACRDMKKCEEARKEIVLDTNNGNVYCRECDLASFKSIRNFVSQFQKDSERLDVLINNAGVMRCPKWTTKDGIEMQLGVNHMGHFLLTLLLLDTLKKSSPSRIVVVSSIAHERGKINLDDLNSDQSYDEGAAYNQSKLANVLFANELAKKLAGTGVTVNSVHPGIVDTDIIRHMSFYSSWIANIFIRPFVWPFVKNPKSGAQTVIALALDPELEKTSGTYFCDLKPSKISEAAADAKTAEWLWRVSEKWTGVSF